MYPQCLKVHVFVHSGDDTLIIILKLATFDSCFLMQSFPPLKGVASVGILVWASLVRASVILVCHLYW